MMRLKYFPGRGTLPDLTNNNGEHLGKVKFQINKKTSKPKRQDVGAWGTVGKVEGERGERKGVEKKMYNAFLSKQLKWEELKKIPAMFHWILIY